MSRLLSVAWVVAALLAALGRLSVASAAPDAGLRIGSVEACVANLPGDGFIEAMQRYDRGITQEAIRDCLEARLREQLGPDRAGLMAAEGSSLQMTLTLSVGKWERVTRGTIRCKGVVGRSVTVIDPGPGGLPLTLEADAGWIICTEEQMLCIRKTIDLHVGLLLAQLAERGIGAARVIPLLPEMLPLSQSSPGGVRFSRYQPQSDSLWDVLPRIASARGTASIAALAGAPRDEVRWATITALGKTTDGLAEPLLIRALNDGHFGVREAAATALGKVGTDNAVAPLRQRRAVENDADVRKAIDRALALLGTLPIKVITAPEGVVLACIPYHDPVTGTVWCVPEPVLAFYKLPATVPPAVRTQVLRGRNVVDLADLVAQVPELGARVALVTTHIPTQRKAYLKRR